MGSPEYRIVYTDPAEQDLRDIFSFTPRRWGRDQLNTYAEKIDQMIAEIMADPHIGRPRLGLLRMTVGRHHIYYRIESETIYIIRVLHNRMDVVRHLS